MIDNPQLPQLRAVFIFFADERFRFGQIAVPVFSWMNLLNFESSGHARTCPGIMPGTVLESYLDLSWNRAWTCPGIVPGSVQESCLDLSWNHAWTCPGIVSGPVLESCLDLSQNHAWTCPGIMPGPVLESCSCDIHVGEGVIHEGVRFCWLCVQ